MATTVSTSSAHSEMTAKELIEDDSAEQDALKAGIGTIGPIKHTHSVMTVIVPALMANATPLRVLKVVLVSMH